MYITGTVQLRQLTGIQPIAILNLAPVLIRLRDAKMFSLTEVCPQFALSAV